MYITLNSATELSDSNFVNSFSEAIVIKPNSYICLSGAGFQTEDTGLNLGYIESFQFRIGFTYNAISKPFTVPAGRYTLDTLCDIMNLLILNFSPQFSMVFNPEDTPDVGVHIRLDVLRNTKTAEEHFYNETYMSNKNELLSPWIGQLRTTTPGEVPILATDGSAAGVDKVWAATGEPGNKYDMLCAGRAPIALISNYNEPINMPNRYGFDMSRLNSGFTTFCIGDGTMEGTCYLTDKIKYNGVDAIDDITGAELDSDYLVKLNLTENGSMTPEVRKEDGTIYTGATRSYGPGDTFRSGLVGVNDADGKAMFKIEHMANTLHQVGWIPFDFLPSDVPTGLPSEMSLTSHLAYQKDYPCGDTEYKNSVHVRAMGSRLAQLGDLNNIQSNAISVEPTFLGLRNVPMQDFNTVTGTNTIMPSGSAMFFTRTPDALNDDFQCLRVARGGLLGIESLRPTCYSVCFRMVADAAGDTYTIMGGVGGGGNPYYIAQVNSGGGTVVEVQSYDGTVNTIQPILNGTGANMPAWVKDKNYCLTVGTAGDANQIISVQVTDEDGLYYAANHVTTYADGQLPDLTHIASDRDPGSLPAGTADNRFHGGIWDFRVHQKTQNQGIPTSFVDWENQHKDIAAYSVVNSNAGVEKPSVWYYNFNDRVDVITPTTDPNLKKISQDATKRICPVLRRVTGVSPLQTNWVNFGNLQANHSLVANNSVSLANTSLKAISNNNSDGFSIMTEDSNPTNNVLVTGLSPSLELLTLDGAGTYASTEAFWDSWTTYKPTPFISVAFPQINNGVNVREQIYNICIENLPHRTLNGRTRNLCKSIYEALHNENQNIVKGNTELINIVPPKKIWIPLNNAGEMPLNEFHVRITNGQMIETSDLIGDTHIHLEIKSRDEIF